MVDQLEKELAVYKNKKNSNNSHIAPSKDENRPKKIKVFAKNQQKNQGVSQGIHAKQWNLQMIFLW